MRKFYKGNMKKVVAAFVCVMMAGSLAACGGSDDEAKTITQEKALAQNEEGDITNVISDSLGLGSETDADKEETVYVISDASGNQKETLVDEWLKNPEKKDEIQDVSDLSDIENVKGDETFSQDGKKLTWKAGGNDIYYQGKTEEQSPVSVSVKYTLDGKEISPDELAGKSGHVKIEYKYINDCKENGVCVPFLMGTGMILHLDKFSNVEAEHAKIISDGSRYIVIGYGMPGLTESLELDKKDIVLPDGFTVEADVQNFELGMSITVASAENIGSEEDIDISDVEKEINDLSHEYQNGMNSLVNGVKDYTGGVEKVSNGVNQLYTGTTDLCNGAGTLSNGVNTAADGASELANGATKLNDGAKQLSTGTASAYSGAKQVSDGAAQLNEKVQAVQLPDISSMNPGEADEETKAAIKSTAEGYLGQDTATYVGGEIGGAINTAVTNSVTPSTVGQVVAYKTSGDAAVQTAAQTAAQNQAATAQSKAVAAATDYAGAAQGNAVAIAQSIYGDAFDPTDPAQQAVIAQITQSLCGAYGEGYGTAYCTGYGSGYADEYITYLTEFNSFSQTLTAQFGGDEFNGTVSGSVTNVANAYAKAGSQVTLGKVGDQMSSFSTQLDALKDGTQKLADGSSSLTTGIGQLNSGASELANGTDALSTGASTLSGGMTQLKDGSQQLYTGTKTLKDGVGTLKAGTDTLVQNNGKLNDGASELGNATDKVIDKLNETEDGVNDFVDNVNKVKAAGRDYQSFAGVRGDMKGKTKFIIKVDGVGETSNP